ncbi:MAG: hypothetical protein CMI16_02855 [Opitutaceae bacterium]|nr:hypothetical protein [Opitutaceae bacterium]
MLSRRIVGLCANVFLLLFLLEASTWRLRNLSEYTSLVSRVTVGTSSELSMASIVGISLAEVGSSAMFLSQKDGRYAAVALVLTQLAKYGLLREVSGAIVIAILLACLRLTEQLDRRSNQTVSSSLWVKLDELLRKEASAYCIGPFLILGVVIEIMGMLLRAGEQGYAGALAHDRTSFSLSVCTMSLYTASFDEKPGKHLEIARETIMKGLEDITPRLEALYQRVMTRLCVFQDRVVGFWLITKGSGNIREDNKRI